jgi:hypothetical protein
MALDVTHPFSEPHVLSLGAILIDRRIEQYRRLGCSRELMLQEMLAAGLPLDTLKARFPEFPDSRFRRPENTHSHISPRPATMPPPSVANPTVDHANHPTVIGQVTAAEGISFQYLPLIQCSFPHTDPKQAATFSRKNGWLELTLGTTNPEVGLPYGVPARLLTIYCTSEAVRTNSSEIYLGDSVHDFLRRLDVPITRGARGSLSVYANQILRLIHSTVSIDENIRDGAGRHRQWQLPDSLERVIPLHSRALRAARHTRHQAPAQKSHGPGRLRLAGASPISSQQTQHGAVVAAVGAIRPQLQ